MDKMGMILMKQVKRKGKMYGGFVKAFPFIFSTIETLKTFYSRASLVNTPLLLFLLLW